MIDPPISELAQSQVLEGVMRLLLNGVILSLALTIGLLACYCLSLLWPLRASGDRRRDAIPPRADLAKPPVSRLMERPDPASGQGVGHRPRPRREPSPQAALARDIPSEAA